MKANLKEIQFQGRKIPKLVFALRVSKIKFGELKKFGSS